MRVPIPKCNCDYCHKKLTDWDYRYKGKHYCKKCYNYLFHFKECSVCKRRRKIYYDLKIAVCKFCQVKNKPCIRCKKSQYKFGKITEFGPVCSSCAKYFAITKTCTECGENNYTVSNRTLIDGDTKLICQKCLGKKKPICSSCGYRRNTYSYLIDTEKPLCKVCTIEVSRVCTQCLSLFPAGKGRICSQCHYGNALTKKTKFISDSLSAYMSEYFNEFSLWLQNRRGVNYTSFRIQYYHPYFFALDNLCEELGRLPTYEEVVSRFSVAETRKYLSVTIFFNKKGIMMVDKITQGKYANIDMINRYLISFEEGSYRDKLIKRYYMHLYSKLENNKTTIRSIRLALTPAVKFLQYCDNFKKEKPNMNMLRGYLWCYPGQRAAITGFINFLFKNFKLQIAIQNIEQIIFKRPTTSKEQLKQRLINLLNADNYKVKNKQEYLFKTAIEYLHGVYVPDNVFINLKDIKINSNKEHYIRISGKTFYLTYELVCKII